MAKIKRPRPGDSLYPLSRFDEPRGRARRVYASPSWFSSLSGGLPIWKATAS